MDILHQRLVNQQIAVHRFSKAGELVQWLAAIQAQDYAMAKWAIGCRLEGITDPEVEKEFNEGRILRTHLLRPTWHFVSPKDIRWMLKLTAPKIKMFTKKHHQDLGIDAGILKRSKKIIEKTMKGEGPLTRKEIQQALTGSHIKTNENRLGFLLMDAELDGLICSAGRRGKQFVYGLLDEMLPDYRIPEGDEAIALLAGRYFTGHGPATVPDFAWWSGLSLKEINRTLPGMKSVLLSENIGGQTYWFSKTMKEIADKPKGCYFLPAFDEYLIGYKDRSHSLDPAFATGVLSSNGIFNPVILEKGKTVGTWKRREQRSGLLIDLFPLSSSVALPQRGIAIAIKKYCRFAGREGRIVKH